MTSPFLSAEIFGNAPALLLPAWFGAAKDFVSAAPADWESRSFAAKINSHFGVLGDLPTRFDPHITGGHFASIRRRKDRRDDNQDKTRPFLLLLEDFKRKIVQDSIRRPVFDGEEDSHNRPRQMLMSPFFFMRKILTAPDYPASEAYAHAVIRAQIFELALAWPVKHSSKGSPLEAIREILSFEKIANSLHKVTSYDKKKDTFYLADQTDVVVGHLLASLGMAAFSFAPGEEVYKAQRQNELTILGRDSFLDNEKLLPLEGFTYEMRVLDDLERIPSASEIINLLDGIPIPIPGAGAVFSGGIRLSSSDRGVVARISGNSGTGKTTFALALATALAPLGINTCYLSCEEDPRDLKHRISTLTPPFIARTASFARKDWFAAKHLNGKSPDDNRADAFGFVHYVNDLLSGMGAALPAPRVPGMTPLLIVLDGVHEMIVRPAGEARDEFREMHELVEHFRQLGVMVLILTAQTDDRSLKELDYLVDIVITLEHENRTHIEVESKRKFVLHKTRQQQAISGAHQFHISKRDGVKLYPQLAAQRDPYKNWRWKGILRNNVYDFLQVGVPNRGIGKPLVNIFERSQILVAGRGSAGKAGFSVKILTAPIFQKDTGANQPGMLSNLGPGPIPTRRRILIASFLFTGDYYNTLQRSMESNRKKDRASQSAPPEIELDVIAFYPGHLTPEILVAKILSKIKAAELEGAPYHGLLIDGLHNVYLQFPTLQQNTMFWPVLYEILRIVGLTVVTTHTQFTVRGMESTPTWVSDVDTVTHRVGPLLQAIVNAADFYLDISRIGDDDTEDAVRVDVVTALGQRRQPSSFYWNPYTAVIEDRSKRKEPELLPLPPPSTS